MAHHTTWKYLLKVLFAKERCVDEVELERSVCTQDFQNFFGIGDTFGFKFGIDQPAIDPDIKAALGSFHQGDRGAQLPAQCVRKTCGVMPVALSQAAIDDGYLHDIFRGSGSWLILEIFRTLEFAALESQDVIAAAHFIGQLGDIEEFLPAAAGGALDFADAVFPEGFAAFLAHLRDDGAGGLRSPWQRRSAATASVPRQENNRMGKKYFRIVIPPDSGNAAL